MKTVIYADVLIAVNMLLTYVSLLLTCTALKTYAKKSRLLLGALLGSVYSFLVFAPDMGVVISIIVKFFMCLTIVCIAFQLHEIRKIIRFCLCFFAVNAAMAGCILLLKMLVFDDVIIMRNGAVYMGVDLKLLLFATAICYALFTLVFKLLSDRKNAQVMKVRIYVDELYIDAYAFVDSGNRLYDPISGKPICIASYSLVKSILPKEIHPFVKGNLNDLDAVSVQWKTRLSVQIAEFAVGESFLPTFRADSIVIDLIRNERRFENCLIGVTTKSFDGLDCQMLLHPYYTDMINYVQGEQNEQAISN